MPNINHQRLVLWLSALIVLAATGCSPLKPSPSKTTNEPWPNHVEQLQHWQLQGKLGIRSPADSGSATILWTQNLGDLDIRLSGPLGSGATRIQAESGSYILHSGGRQFPPASSPEALMLQHLGWWLPVSEMPYWVKGVASPNYPIEAIRRGPQGQLLGLQQLGWNIAYDRYDDSLPLPLPGKVTVERGDFRATLIVRQWMLLP